MNRPRPLLLLAALLVAVPAASAKEMRCGWLENPTPANWWLTDRDASWTIMTQGNMDGGAEGMDLLPQFGETDWIETNNPGSGYGYGCACLTVDVDAAEERITMIHAARKLPLSQCRNDKALPRQD